MHPFGGTHNCPRCSKAVYAAEQVLGPGRKLYHKPCLTCKSCNKRLDSLSLVEHDEEPFCKNCHVKTFGTRDLRHLNLPHFERQSPPVSPTARTFSPPPLNSIRATNTGTSGGRFPSPVRSLNTGNGAGILRPTRTLVTSPTLPNFPRRTPTPPEAVSNSYAIPEEEPDQISVDNADPVKPSSTGELSQDQQLQQDNNTDNRTVQPLVRSFSPVRRHQCSSSLGSISSPLTRSNGAAAAAARLLEEEGISPPLIPNGTGAGAGIGTGIRPMIIPAATGSRYGAALGGTVTDHPTGSSTGSLTFGKKQWGGGTPVCPKCSKNVYFAEQVKAVGKTFHKGCLRCTECNTSLDSTRLRDHEGDPFCVRCYSKLHGPQGSGYALLGKAGA